MRLATRDDGTRDGELVVVANDGERCASARSVAATLQAALDDWERAEPALRALARALDEGQVSAEPLAGARLRAPLPRAYEWIDGSAYINHIVLVRKARGAAISPTLETDPLVYQGGSGCLLGPNDDIPWGDAGYGLDYEAELCCILGDTPRGTKQTDAAKYVQLFLLANDVTLRNLVPDELAKGFGFFVSKPATAFSPFAVTPDERGAAYRDGRVHLPLLSFVNGEKKGDPDAGPEMHFSFFDLIEHVTRTRSLTAGTLLGSGTVSNADETRGVSCLAEKRTREVLAYGEPTTPFLATGDVVRIEMRDETGRSVFGAIEQRIVR